MDGERRHADLEISPDGRLLVCVRERHDEDGVTNELVVMPSDGSGEPRVLAGGPGFYSAPRISPDGSRLAWISWHAPRMPWDGCLLWVVQLRRDGTVAAPTLVAGGADESVSQPLWSPDGVLHLLDVDYRGSTGYGRAYRNALRGRWGELDVTDCVDAVEYLADTGRINPDRVAICGSSAGGYTALRALATTDVFAAAAVLHAVIEPATWRRSAPAFQHHHTDLLVAPPTDTSTYRARSVLAHAHRITAPVLIIHGERDTVTPSAEAHRLATALGDRAALLTFADEGHGLRHPEHVARALHAELDHLRWAGLAPH